MHGDILYFLFQPGCPACEAAKTPLREFEKTVRPRMMVLRLNVAAKDWHIRGWSPKGTPGWALVRNGELVAQHVGYLNAAELQAWVQAGLAEPELAEEES